MAEQVHNTNVPREIDYPRAAWKKTPHSGVTVIAVPNETSMLTSASLSGPSTTCSWLRPTNYIMNFITNGVVPARSISTSRRLTRDRLLVESQKQLAPAGGPYARPGSICPEAEAAPAGTLAHKYAPTSETATLTKDEQRWNN